jgi:hypothetical protein
MYPQSQEVYTFLQFVQYQQLVLDYSRMFLNLHHSYWLWWLMIGVIAPVSQYEFSFMILSSSSLVVIKFCGGG